MIRSANGKLTNCSLCCDEQLQCNSKFFAFLDCQIIVLQCSKSIPMPSLFDISFYSDCIFIKLCQIVLTISITMLCGTASPI